jgi:predicted O-methyltransferase YrrM
MRGIAKRALERFGRTKVGLHFIHAAVASDRAPLRFPEVEHWPTSSHGFEDLAFLFRSSQLNHGIASLRFDEAAHLYAVVRALGPSTIAELGRYRGGSTIVIASAMASGSELWSYDLHLHRPEGPRGEDLDRELTDALARLDLGAGVRLLVADTRTADPPPRQCDLVFVDADHSYEGALADIERWAPLVRLGGHMLFHDAVDTHGWGLCYPGVTRAVEELERESGVRRIAEAGTIAHLVIGQDASSS